jgi:hypothetical protein
MERLGGGQFSFGLQQQQPVNEVSNTKQTNNRIILNPSFEFWRQV